MLKMAVVDDEYNVAAQTERCLMKECNKLQLNVEVDVFCSGEEIIRFIGNKNMYHVIFLDIEMGMCSGIDVSRYIRDMLQDEITQIVFVTGKSEYDRQLFEFRPFAFLEKPVDTEKIGAVLAKYVRIYGENNDTFEYKVGHGYYFVKISDIFYFESVDRKVKIKTAKEENIFYGSVLKLYEQLENRGFFMPHKSYLVNYRLVKVFQPDCLLLTNGEQIPIAKGKRKEVAKMQLKLEKGGI